MGLKMSEGDRAFPILIEKASLSMTGEQFWYFLELLQRFLLNSDTSNDVRRAVASDTLAWLRSHKELSKLPAAIPKAPRTKLVQLMPALYSFMSINHDRMKDQRFEVHEVVEKLVWTLDDTLYSQVIRILATGVARGEKPAVINVEDEQNIKQKAQLGKIRVNGPSHRGPRRVKAK